MTEDELVTKKAFDFIKSHRQLLFDTFCAECKKVNNPISVFMAGSPGAGKTEVSIGLIDEFDDRPVRIDADEIRMLCPNYNGTNAHLFQKAASKGVDLLYDFTLAKKY